MGQGWRNKGLLVAVLVVVVAVAIGASSYNNLVRANERINGLWAEVENQLQRRYDLIPRLVETVKGYASHEREVFTSIAEARAKLASGGLAPEERVEAANQMESALARLLVVVERYPDLKANENFRALMDELTGTESRLAVARMRFNEATRVYNTSVKSFPTMLFARAFGFKERAYFEIAEEARTAPEVKFR